MIGVKPQLLGFEAVMNEVVNSQWLINYSGLLQLGFFMQQVAKGEATQRKKEEASESPSFLEFYNEEGERIHPTAIHEIPEGSTAVVKIIGPMMKYGSWWMLGANEIVANLDFLNNLQNISSIVAYIDGPGGAASAIYPFMDFAKRKRKPIIGLCNNSLSLHRWIPDAICDYQIAEDDITARIGSIGVVSSWMDATKYYEDLGVKIFEVYPEESKHKNEIWRAIKEDEEKGLQLLRDMHLSPMAKEFQAAVKAAHPGLQEEEGVLTGRTFFVDDAVRLGLVNKKGNMNDAVQMGKALAEAYSINNH